MQDILLPLDTEMEGKITKFAVNEESIKKGFGEDQKITISYPMLTDGYKKNHFTFLSSEALYTLVTEFKPRFLLEDFSMGQLNLVHYETIFSVKNEAIRSFGQCQLKFKIKDSGIKFNNVKSLAYSIDGIDWHSENRLLTENQSGMHMQGWIVIHMNEIKAKSSIFVKLSTDKEFEQKNITFEVHSGS